jgi:predicted ATPase/transcriptional regulator with XRE-family HTH domain
MSPGPEAPFGARLRRLREAAGLTQEELAMRSGLSVAAVSALERGLRRHPYPHTVRSLADALGLAEGERAELLAAVPKRAAPRSSLRASPSLPVPPTPLVGRERDVKEVVGHLLDPGVRLLTLVGPGGVGKTRLAIEAASNAAASFPDGVGFVELTEVGDPARFAPAVARALGLREGGDEPPLDLLSGHLLDKGMLLVLDNFEQVLPAALLLVRLLSACPRLKALVTSRVALAARGERRFPVPPLGVPPRSDADTEAAARYPAAALFVGRARAVDPSFKLTDANAPAVAGICRCLDGLPLAIELAASRTNLLSPEALLARLSPGLGLLVGGAPDVPERQRTMRATVAWSYDLLAEEERVAFRRVSVFEGGCTLEAAESVCAGPGERLDVLDAFSSLADASLLGRRTGPDGGPRLAMLAVVREYARELLAGAGEDALARERHALYFLGLAEAAEPELYEPDHPAWLDRLELEHDNLRAALGWARETGDVGLGLRLAGSLRWFWWIRGHLGEGREWLRAFLDEDAVEGGPHALAPARAKALYAAGQLAFGQGDLARAARLYGEGLAAYRALGDGAGTATVLAELGQLARAREDHERAAALSEEALALGLGARNGLVAAIALNTLGHVRREAGDLDGAVARFEESLAHIGEGEHRRGVAYGLSSLGGAALERGEHERALGLHEQALELYKALGDKAGVAMALVNLGDVARERGEGERAAALYEEALAMHRGLGNRRGADRALGRLSAIR